MVRTQIQLTEKQAASLKKIASANRISMAEVIRKAVDAAIREGAFLDPEEQKKRALAITGRFRSGRRDISKNHDRHLAEAYGE